MTENREPRVRWGWIVFAVVLGLIVLFVSGYGSGECHDAADAAASRCTTGPFIGPVGVWAVWIAYVFLAVYAVWQAVRRR